MITKLCAICEKPFDVQPYREQTALYCSLSCRSKGTFSVVRTHFDRKGKAAWNKGKKGTHFSPATEFKPSIFGSANPRWKQPLQRQCEHCGDTFERKPWQVSRPKHPGRFCGLLCYRKFKSLREAGPNAKDWVGGELSYRGRNWKQIRLIVVERQKGNCARCRKYIGKSLAINHEIAYREFLIKDAANALVNLKGYCQSCHMKVERRPSRV